MKDKNLIKKFKTLIKFTFFIAIFAPRTIADDIYLNFESASLNSVVNYLAEQKKINLIPMPSIVKDLEAKKVSLTTHEVLSLESAWDVLLTLLEMNGYSIINVDNVYRIVASTTDEKEPLPIYSSQKGTKPEDLPDSDLVVRYIYILKNIATKVASDILTNLLGPNKVRINEQLSTCIITDKCFNIKSAMKIIMELDVGGLREAIRIKRLKYTDATYIHQVFSNIIAEKEKGDTKTIRIITPNAKKEIAYFSSDTKIIPETQRNSLIFLGLEKNINKIVEFIEKYLDIPMDEAATRIHIKELKYVKATDLKKILDVLVKPPTTPAAAGATTPPKIVGEFKFFEDVMIEAENPKAEGDQERATGNRLVISCGKEDWKRLEHLIEKLDKPQPQVGIEVMVVDIDNEDAKNLGTQIRQKTGKSIGHGFNAFTANLKSITVNEDTTSENYAPYNPNLIDAATGNQGTTSITFGKEGDIWAVIQSFLSSTHTEILSQPYIVTNNNQKCTVSVKTTKQILGKISNDGYKQVQNYEPYPASTILNIIPRINSDGIIDLNLDVTLNEFTGEGVSDQPDKTNRAITTRASMATGEVLVIGGLRKDKVTDNNYKTPILGDVPIIGSLFKSRQKTINKTNLYVFIRPSIIKPKFEGGADEYTQLKLDYAKYQIFNAEEIQKTKDPIQRWFFKPEKQSIHEKISDIRKGIYRPIDDYAEGKTQPNSVRIQRDPYYRAASEVKREEQLIKHHKETK